MANITDGRCWAQVKPKPPSGLFQTHDIGWIVAGCFTFVSIVVSAWLINKHLLYYTDKREQRYIVRILFMVPIYAIISFASYLFWNESTPLILLRDGYEATVLTSFFYLLLNYISHDLDEQRAVFLRHGLSREYDREQLRQRKQMSKWMFPLGFVQWKPQDGLYFLQLMKWGVLQYCVILPVITLAGLILNYLGLYCDDSWGLEWGHPYITAIQSISVTIAMYCLLQLYLPISKDLASHKPLLKLFSVKAIVFLTFWQSIVIDLVAMFGLIKETQYMTEDDIEIGIAALAETFEMMLFAALHIKAFTYKDYLPGKPNHSSQDYSKELPTYPDHAFHNSRYPRLRALGHAFDFRETFVEVWAGCVYMYEKHILGKQEVKVDVAARRVAHYESAFGRERESGLNGKGNNAKKTKKEEKEKNDPLAFPMIRVEREYYDSTHGRQWIGYGPRWDEYYGSPGDGVGGGNGYDYGYEYPDGSGYGGGRGGGNWENRGGYGRVLREKSDDLEVQIERELHRRGLGYASEIPGRGHLKPVPDGQDGNEFTHQKQQKSWWKSIYNRLSQSGPEEGGSTMLTSAPSRGASRKRSSKINPRSREPSKSRESRGAKELNGRKEGMPNETEGTRLFLDQKYDIEDDPPPPSLFKSNKVKRKSAPSAFPPSRGRNRQSRGGQEYSAVSQHDVHDEQDTLAPLEVFNEHHSSYLQRQQHQQRNVPSPNTTTLLVASPVSLPMSPPSSPPPQSFLVPHRAPLRLDRTDVPPNHPISSGAFSEESLLGRMFPSKSSEVNISTVHGTDNTHETGYHRDIPRSAIPSREGGYEIGIAGERVPAINHGVGIAMGPKSEEAMVVESLVPSMQDLPGTTRNAGTRHFSPRSLSPPPPAMPTPILSSPFSEAAWLSQAPLSPSSPPFASSPSPPPQPHHRLSSPLASPSANPKGLRRSSAQVYSPHSPRSPPPSPLPYSQSPPPRSQWDYGYNGYHGNGVGSRSSSRRHSQPPSQGPYALHTPVTAYAALTPPAPSHQSLSPPCHRSSPPRHQQPHLPYKRHSTPVVLTTPQPLANRPPSKASTNDNTNNAKDLPPPPAWDAGGQGPWS